MKKHLNGSTLIRQKRVEPVLFKREKSCNTDRHFQIIKNWLKFFKSARMEQCEI